MFLSIVNTNFRRLTNNIYLSSKHVLNMVNRVMMMMKSRVRSVHDGSDKNMVN